MTQLPFTTETGEPRTGYVLDIFNPRTILPCEDNARRVALLKAIFGFDEHARRFTKPLPSQPFQTDLLTYILFDHVSERRTEVRTGTAVLTPHGPRRPRRLSISKMIEEAERAGKPVTSITTPDGLRTPAEAARKLRCSVKTLNAHVAAGDLGYVIIGKGTKRPHKMFNDADLNAFIANQTRKDSPCPSTKSLARHTGTLISTGEVIDFRGPRRPAPSGKRKR